MNKMRIDEEVIKKELKKALNVDCEFYRGSKKVRFAKISRIRVSTIEVGDYSNNCNCMIVGTGDFAEIISEEDNFDLCENEHFSTFIWVENGEIKSISRIDMQQKPF